MSRTEKTSVLRGGTSTTDKVLKADSDTAVRRSLRLLRVPIYPDTVRAAPAASPAASAAARPAE